MAIALALCEKEGFKKEDNQQKGVAEGKGWREGGAFDGFDWFLLLTWLSLQKSGFRKEDSFPFVVLEAKVLQLAVARVLTQVCFVWLC